MVKAQDYEPGDLGYNADADSLWVSGEVPQLLCLSNPKRAFKTPLLPGVANGIPRMEGLW